MVEPSTVIFVSVLFLVVINLSIIVRDDLERKAMQYSDHITGIPILEIPNLGRFTFIHALNVSLLFFGYWVVFGDHLQNRTDMGAVLLLAIGLILLILPFIEIDSYEDRFKDGESPKSYSFHLKFTLASTVVLPILTVAVAFFFDSRYVVPFFTVLFVALWFIGIHRFLTLVLKENTPSGLD